MAEYWKGFWGTMLVAVGLGVTAVALSGCGAAETDPHAPTNRGDLA